MRDVYVHVGCAFAWACAWCCFEYVCSYWALLLDRYSSPYPPGPPPQHSVFAHAHALFHSHAHTHSSTHTRTRTHPLTHAHALIHSHTRTYSSIHKHTHARAGAGKHLDKFFSQWWPRLRIGGYMLVHSTLTNALTREWLERVRSRVHGSRTHNGGEGVMGAGSLNMSFLEPHKMFQNSFSIFQKRGDKTGQYKEPVLTKFP